MARPDTHILGREAELGRLRAFVEGDRSPIGLVLAGGPGIGKTTFWEAGIDAAGACGSKVLSARSSGSEMHRPEPTSAPASSSQSRTFRRG